MFATALSRPVLFLASICSGRRAKTPPARGPMPTWLNDRELSKQLLKDTGLSPEDLGGSPSYDDQKPFFMQQNFW